MLILAELNRRNIFRVALLYIVAAWLLLQISNFLILMLGIPDWAYRFIFALLLICFPLALLFSWVFEITPEGLKREQHVDSQSSITHITAGKINRLTIILFAAAVLMSIVCRVVGG